MSGIVFIVTFAICMALGYGITAGLLWLICLCFGWEWWSWQMALGIWLVLVVLKAAFGRSDK